MTDYCLHPDLCGIGQDCSECHQNHVQQLKAEISRLRQRALCVVQEKARQMDGVHRDKLRDFPHLLDDINQLEAALQENSGE
jgi:hypothetical protein